MKSRTSKLILGMLMLFVIGSLSNAFAQTDPGVRGGPAGAGAPIAGLTSQERQFFEQGLEQFLEVQSVQGELFFPDTEPGLGPTFNMNSCAGCHAQPATGGTSPFVNPQVAVAALGGATNVLPSFITFDGPVREARFKRNPDGTPDGGVHGLFTIADRVDAPGCDIAQPDFAAQLTANNVVFRIPTPLFGAGLIENIPDFAILENKRLSSTNVITGRENREGNAGTITRFGWKAQNKSLVIFSGEAYLVEQGVTNELFPQEREDKAASDGRCLFNPLPEDITNALKIRAQNIPSNIDLFAMFQRFLAPPAPVTAFTGLNGPVSAASIANGRIQFQNIGCNSCHTPQLTTGNTTVAALSNQPVNLFSDLLVHNMGTGLADGISQGNAGPDEFRTAPLWGVGQRIFFLHDGRTDDLLVAIAAHSSRGSEANGVIRAFNGLTSAQKLDILNFLRSL